MEKTFIQLVKFLLFSLIASVVELIVFALCNYVLFTSLADIPFNWFVFRYDISNGGLCSFLSMGISFTAAQITNFFVQRKLTFKSKSNPVQSAVKYAVVVVIMYIYVLVLPRFIGPFFYSLFGESLGALLVKILSQTSSALIQFPINKFIVMK